MAIEAKLSPDLTVWKMRRVRTGIGGAYMIGIFCMPLDAAALTGTTSRSGTARVRAEMPFTSFSWASDMPCFLAIDSSVSPFFG